VSWRGKKIRGRGCIGRGREIVPLVTGKNPGGKKKSYEEIKIIRGTGREDEANAS